MDLCIPSLRDLGLLGNLETVSKIYIIVFLRWNDHVGGFTLRDNRVADTFRPCGRKGGGTFQENSSMEARKPRTITPRETEVMALVAEGRRNREVAKDLGISVKTVETHRANIMNKLAFRNVAQLIVYAIQKGLVVVEIDQAAG